jgi:endonuclease/exonuclease/phosphatase family metal-dependent hydrolase
MRQITFGSYNLETGGIDGGRDDRLRRQLAMLADAGADVWAFQECDGWRDAGYRAFHLAERTLGMRGFLARSSHHGCDVAVFVRETAGIRVTGQRHEEGPPYWHGLARLDAEADGFGPLHLVSAHLAPSSSALRLVEAEAFALVAKDGPVIAGGDWNATPADDPEPSVGGVPAGRIRRKLDRSAALAIEEAGFTDAAARLGDYAPTVGHANADGLAYRCDRVYTTLPAEWITGYQVITEDHPASDHRPVVANFTLRQQAA